MEAIETVEEILDRIDDLHDRYPDKPTGPVYRAIEAAYWAAIDVYRNMEDTREL